MSAQGVQDAPAVAVGSSPGQWRPVRPNTPRTPKQCKRELRKDRHRRRRIAERAEHDPTLTDFEVRVLKGYLCRRRRPVGRRVEKSALSGRAREAEGRRCAGRRVAG